MEGMSGKNKYVDFNERDFICDEYFQNWVIRPDTVMDEFWESWLKQYPEKSATIERSRLVLNQIGFAEHWPTEQRVQEALENSFEMIDKMELVEAARKNKIYRLKRIWKIAAVFIGLLVLGGLYYLNTKSDYSQKETATAYGKIKKMTLPDSSEVVLNANSRVVIKQEWSKSKPRELWLDGEAFFNIRHINKDSTGIQPYERFLVHTTDLTVEVLGTSFDIRQRRNKTEIVLQTGKIKISFNNGTRPDVIMKPGDIVIYDPAANQLSRAVTVAENYSSWTDKKLDLARTKLPQIIEYLEDNYGYKIILADPALMKRNIGGIIPLENLDDALFALSIALHVNIVKQDSTLIIRPK